MKVNSHNKLQPKSTYLFVGILLVLLLPGIAISQENDTTKKGLDYIGHYLLYRNHDSSYIKNYSQKISAKLVAINKYNRFSITDRNNKTSIRYTPLQDVSLGLGVAYKWFSIDLTFSLGLNKNSDFENTRAFDFQGSIFSSKQFITFTLQYYQAYQIYNIRGVDVNLSEAVKRREDIRTISVGLQYLFATNYTKFSLKAPFVQNEGQRKSAGSPIVGASFNIFVMDADSSIIPQEVSEYFNPNLSLTDLNIINVSLSLGYMYSFVYKKRFFLTLSLIPGINIGSGDYYTNSRQYSPLSIHVKLTTRNAIGYNSSKFFTGFQYNADAYFSTFEKKLLAQIGYGKFSLFIGYRFGKK
jgi:hypothetical protein